MCVAGGQPDDCFFSFSILSALTYDVIWKIKQNIHPHLLRYIGALGFEEKEAAPPPWFEVPEVCWGEATNAPARLIEVPPCFQKMMNYGPHL